ncbi:hypothetical protein HK098_007212 [Nowakowskiella sp. JEL0407]|nr:hypothetical protein HK098_007212 [Nowakowskiella sp. JEL0407]
MASEVDNVCHGRIDRLLFIAEHCPPLQLDAYKLALDEIVKFSDLNKYYAVLNRYNEALTLRAKPECVADANWVKANSLRNLREKIESLEVEFRNRKNMGLKDEIRASCIQLGEHYYSCGDLSSSLKYYTQAREYCSTPAQLADICMEVIKVSIELGNFTHVQSYVVKAESISLSDKKQLTAKLKCSTGLVNLVEAEKFSRAARSFLDVNFELGSSFSEILSPNDVAIYGGLCALASFDRADLKHRVIENSEFKQFLELEPQIRELIYAFYNSKYTTCLELMQRLKPDLLLDMFLHNHVDVLYENIRKKALVQYFSPFSSVDMNKMAKSFNTTVSQLEAEIATLIGENQIQARIDSHNKVLRIKKTDQRTQIFEKALKMSDEYQLQTKHTLLRMKLLRADLVELYTMSWKDVDLSKFMVAASPFGGPLALIRNDRKILALQSQHVKPVMHIYSSSGKLINQFQWDKGRIVGMGWTRTEHLICVLEYGSVRVYDIHGEFTQFSLGQDAKDYGVYECEIWDSGLVALTGNYKLVAITDFEEPRPKYLSDPGLMQAPHSWTIIPPQFTLSRHVEVLLAVNNTILVTDASSVQDQVQTFFIVPMLTQGPFTRISVAPNGRVLALFTTDGRLWVVSSDFQKNLAEFSTNSTTPPIQMTWCGVDSVVLHWEDTVLMVGPFGDWIKYSYEGVVQLVPEVDGVRIVTNEKCEFLQRVPDSCEKVFKIGSTAPGAILYDALEHFEKKSPKADENIRNIKPELAEAVDTCVECAGEEFYAHRQKLLLKAASFGKCFLDTYNSEYFVSTCQIIRVLNALRNFEIGIPLTITQYKRLTPEVLINRLVNRHHHLLALRVCEYLGINKDRVLIHWACAKIKRSVDDEDTLCRLIVEKLGGDKTGLSFAEVAKTAYQSGHTKLATRLLDYEPQAANQVPLLMSMQEDELALIKAIESGDNDLVYLVMLHMKGKLPTADFFRIVNGKPLACSLLETYSKQQDLKLLKDFYYQDDRRGDSANIMVVEAYRKDDLSARVNQLRVSQKLYQEDKDYAFEAKATEEQTKLLEIQAQLEKDTGHSFLELSLSETIFKCLLLGHGNRAAKIKSDFKVPDKRFWWLKVKALVKALNWEGLEKFAKSNPKFGFSGIIDTLIKANQLHQAKLFLDLMIKTGGAEKELHAERYKSLLGVAK